MMKIQSDAQAQLIRQVDAFYGIRPDETAALERVYEKSVNRMAFCFRHIANKYYQMGGGGTTFNPLHVGQWTMFLYQMARSLILDAPEKRDLCDKLYGLSKCFSSADIYYEVEMPDIWFFDHPQGSVMGRAFYRNYFSFSQGCTVGNNKGKYPRFGEHVSIMSNAKVLGDCAIGHHVIFAANSYVIDRDVPPYSIVFGMEPNPVIRSISPEKFDELTASLFLTDERVSR